MEFLAAWSQRVVSNPASKCSDSAGMNDSIRQAFLNEHNRLSSNYYISQLINTKGSSCPGKCNKAEGFLHA
ncbi:hypothetical protein OESDEN_10226 [Oesophagostomum dentatum]|uniref:SCP domain-containing protein n=1 Tax=Oesophagostomum dentatum TaxID=61180 RepID=A0A0B1T3F2_OESDE|nr:hypothetical protein OESDEN_10226 [Oesophagostomum dentatum]